MSGRKGMCEGGRERAVSGRKGMCEGGGGREQ